MTTTTAKKPAARKAATRTVKADSPNVGKVGDLLHLSPDDLDFAVNIRRDLELDSRFVESIKNRGVQVPLMASYDPLGTLLVWDGQRRLHAARQLRLKTVPVVVTDAPGDEADRILSQDLVNHHRAALAAADQVEAYAQLAAFGMSPETIAKKTSREVTEVQAGLKVANAKAASAAAAMPALDFPRLAKLADLEEEVNELYGDGKSGTEIVAELAQVAESEGAGGFDHAFARRMQEVEKERLTLPRIDELVARGITVLDERPAWSDKVASRLHNLADADGNRLDPETHVSCPGHAVAVSAFHRGYGADEALVLSEDEYCMDWRAYGHLDYHDTRTPMPDLSEEEREAARAAKRRIREFNAASVASSHVRHEWLAEFFQRKKLPADAMKLAAQLIATSQAGDHTYREMLWQLFGAEDPGYMQKEKLSAIPTPGAGEKWLLAKAVADIEHTMTGNNKNYWQEHKNPHTSTRYSQYLKTLEAWGYTLSPIERLAAYSEEPEAGE